MPIDQEKLAKLQKLSAKNKIGGTRRKLAKKTNSTANGQKDDTKLQAQLAKFHAVTIDNVAEANFFKEDGKVLHFNKVGVQTVPQHNTSVFYGIPQEKAIQELFPGIISQMDTGSLAQLAQLANQMQSAQQAGGDVEATEGEENKDEAIPELTEGQTFDADVE